MATRSWSGSTRLAERATPATAPASTRTCCSLTSSAARSGRGLGWGNASQTALRAGQHRDLAGAGVGVPAGRARRRPALVDQLAAGTAGDRDGDAAGSRTAVAPGPDSCPDGDGGQHEQDGGDYGRDPALVPAGYPLSGRLAGERHYAQHTTQFAAEVVATPG